MMVRCTRIRYINMKLSISLIALGIVLQVPAVALAEDSGASWPMAGQNLSNTRHQAQETTIGPDNVAKLAPKWTVTLCGSVWATPAVKGDYLYVPDTAGYLYKINKETGKYDNSEYHGAKAWAPGGKCRGPGGPPQSPPPALPGPDPIPGLYLGDVTGVTAEVYLSTVTPAIEGTGTCGPGTAAGKAGSDILILGDRSSALPNVFAVGLDGGLVWKTQLPLDTPAFAKIVQSPIVYKNKIYVGVGSGEEGRASKKFLPDYECCAFRGRMYALDLCDGGVVSSFDTISPPPPGVAATEWFSGASILGSTAVIDEPNDQLIFTTGNNYNGPPASTEQPDDTRNLVESIVALDLETFTYAWHFSATSYDAWNLACTAPTMSGRRNCPTPPGKDYDFIQGPMLATVYVSGERVDVVAAAQKSGKFWVLRRGPLGDGEKRLVYSVNVGPGGLEGGSEFGSAYDGKNFYVAISNSLLQEVRIQKRTTLNRGLPCPRVCRSRSLWDYDCSACTPFQRVGYWNALTGTGGYVAWQTFELLRRDPPEMPMPPLGGPQGAVTVANGVLYGGTKTAGPLASYGPSRTDGPSMFAFDATFGYLKWSFPDRPHAGLVTKAGPAVVDGVVYWGATRTSPKHKEGHAGLPLGPAPLYAFHVP